MRACQDFRQSRSSQLHKDAVMVYPDLSKQLKARQGCDSESLFSNHRPLGAGK